MSINGKKKFLELALKDSSPSLINIRLFVNNITPSSSSAVADFIEMTEHAYVSKSPAKATWTTSTIAETENVTIENVNQVFVLDGTGDSKTIYGYYIVVNDGTLKLLGAESFATPIVVGGSGATITIKPKLQYN